MVNNRSQKKSNVMDDIPLPVVCDDIVVGVTLTIIQGCCQKNRVGDSKCLAASVSHNGFSTGVSQHKVSAESSSQINPEINEANPRRRTNGAERRENII